MYDILKLQVERVKLDDDNLSSTNTFQHGKGSSSRSASEMKTNGEIDVAADKDRNSNYNSSVEGIPESIANDVQNTNQIRNDVDEKGKLTIGFVHIDDEKANISKAQADIVNDDENNLIPSLYDDIDKGTNNDVNIIHDTDNASKDPKLQDTTSKDLDNTNDHSKESGAKVNVFPEEILVSTAPKVMSTYGISEIVSATKVARRLRANRQISTKKLWE